MILCLAYRLGLVSPNQQWLFIGRASINFRAILFSFKGTKYNCSDEDMKEALEMNLLMLFKLTPFEKDYDETTVSGITFNEFL